MKQVSINRNGKTYSGTYRVENRTIYVTYAGLTKPTQISGMKDQEQMLAEMILGELIGHEAT